MAFKEVQSLDADVVIALGKKDKKTGKAYPKTAEGYYLGSRTVQNKRGESTLHFLQTDAGNLGIWGTTDLNRKLGQVEVGTMIRVTSTGTKATPNGDMYTYRVEIDNDNTITVLTAGAGNGAVAGNNEEYVEDADDDDGGDEYAATGTDGNDEELEAAQAQAQAAAARKAKVEALLKSKRTVK